MASEVNHHVGYSQANECWFVRFYPYQTEQQASEAAAAFTRPAPAATDTGLVTVAYETWDGDLVYRFNGPCKKDDALVYRSQAEELLAAERAAQQRLLVEEANEDKEAIEAKLAAAEKALEPFADHAKERAVDAPEWRDTDTVRIVVTIGDLRKA